MVLGVGATEFGTASSDLQIVRQTGNIQFAGTEDLGGGLKAGFQLQTAIGAAGTTNVDNDQILTRTLLGDRYANLTLSGGFGGFLIGLANTGIKNVMGVADVSGLPVATGIDASTSSAGTEAKGGLVVTAGDTNARIIYGSTYTKQVSYQSPTINGITVAVGISPNQSTSTGIGDNSDTKDAVSYAVTYANGPLTATVNYTDSATGTTPSKATTVAASYDLGVAKIAVAQQGIRMVTGVSPGNGIMLTANVPVGPGAFGLGYGRRTATLSSAFGDDVKQTFMGYKYNLSKRTSLSAVYNQIDRTGTATDLKETHLFVGHSF